MDVINSFYKKIQLQTQRTQFDQAFFPISFKVVKLFQRDMQVIYHYFRLHAMLSREVLEFVIILLNITQSSRFPNVVQQSEMPYSTKCSNTFTYSCHPVLLTKIVYIHISFHDTFAFKDLSTFLSENFDIFYPSSSNLFFLKRFYDSPIHYNLLCSLNPNMNSKFYTRFSENLVFKLSDDFSQQLFN